MTKPQSEAALHLCLNPMSIPILRTFQQLVKFPGGEQGCIIFLSMQVSIESQYQPSADVSSAGESVSDSSGVLVHHPAQETSASCGQQL